MSRLQPVRFRCVRPTYLTCVAVCATVWGMSTPTRSQLHTEARRLEDRALEALETATRTADPVAAANLIASAQVMATLSAGLLRAAAIQYVGDNL